jgi:hypothetical protein
MNKEEIINTITEALKAKLIGTTHCKNRTIMDVRVLIDRRKLYNDIYHYTYYDEIDIEVLAMTKKGKTKTWMPYHIE